jgi:hypothetical protein
LFKRSGLPVCSGIPTGGFAAGAIETDAVEIEDPSRSRF